MTRRLSCNLSAAAKCCTHFWVSHCWGKGWEMCGCVRTVQGLTRQGKTWLFLGEKVPSQLGDLVDHHVYRTWQPQTFSGRAYDYAACPGCNQKLNISTTGATVIYNIALLQRTMQNIIRLQKYGISHVTRILTFMVPCMYLRKWPTICNCVG
jgi:hypothetical protein